ncbi:tetratricopeptide repeat protein [Natranaerobius thermophilus]|uniref:TPR repeat-containing protein n=1 Tax=Natranaerobius thermophilus (strain ATCC BAA-1301 / DSM 18059 / JW/NM-WN-LF) TaxID=457570 RepID=B2A717_NATTJ|nr:tetratricopeptide repeat protein [Natranaerobius thermophilus]ACB85608.1 TPR repeat-containing protein [Natranaerobius thermophilus JW/NM-WN-LF]
MKIPQIKADSKDKLSSGGNLRRIRSELGLRQHEITGDLITRNLISLIENEKTPLYERNARLIAQSINQLNKQKGILAYIDAEDILNPEKYDAKKIADSHINLLKDRLDEGKLDIKDEEVSEIEKLFRRWNIPDKRAITYELLGDIYNKKGQSYEEYYFYSKALESLFALPLRFPNEYQLFLKLIVNRISNNSYSEALKLANLAFFQEQDIPSEYLGHFYYYLALCQEKLFQYEQALKNSEQALKFIDDRENLTEVYLLKGNCCTQLGNLDKALISYYKASDLIEEEEEAPQKLITIYFHLLQVYKTSNEQSKIENYLNKIRDIINRETELSDDTKADHFYKLSEFAYYLEDFNTYEQLLVKALDLSYNCEDSQITSSILARLIDHYYKSNALEKVDNLIVNYQDSIVKLSDEPSIQLLTRIILHYLNQNSTDKSKTILKQLFSE